MQQGRHAAGGVADLELGFDPRRDLLGRKVQVFLQMQVEPIELRVAQQHIAVAVLDPEQLLQSTGAIALEVSAYRIGGDQQGLGNVARLASRTRAG